MGEQVSNQRQWGRIVGGLLRVFTLGYLGQKKAEANTNRATSETMSKQIGKVAKVLLVCALGVSMTAASCQDFAIGVIEGAAGKGPITEPSRPPVPSEPTPPPNLPAGAVFGEMPPGRVCGQNDSCCWHDPGDDCDHCWLFISCSTPAPTATPTSVPTVMPMPRSTPTPHPTQSPTPRGFTGYCLVRHEPWLLPALPDTPIPVCWDPNKPTPNGFDLIGPDKNGRHGIGITYKKAVGEQGRTPAHRMHESLTRRHVIIDSDCMVRDVDNGVSEGEDAAGRIVLNGRLVLPSNTWWGDGHFAWPEECPIEPPVPIPPPVTTQPRDFRFAWANVSDGPRAFKDHGNGTCSYESDGALRWGGTLASGEFYQNTADRDHWNCAIETCTPHPGQTNDEFVKMLAEHQKTYELVGGDEWVTPSGITLEVEDASNAATKFSTEKQKNPYQSYVEVPCGTIVKVRGCLDKNSYSCQDKYRGELREDAATREEKDKHYSEFDCRPEHRRPIPGFGCGAWKNPFKVGN